MSASSSSVITRAAPASGPAVRVVTSYDEWAPKRAITSAFAPRLEYTRLFTFLLKGHPPPFLAKTAVAPKLSAVPDVAEQVERVTESSPLTWRFLYPTALGRATMELGTIMRPADVKALIEWANTTETKDTWETTIFVGCLVRRSPRIERAWITLTKSQSSESFRLACESNLRLRLHVSCLLWYEDKRLEGLQTSFREINKQRLWPFDAVLEYLCSRPNSEHVFVYGGDIYQLSDGKVSVPDPVALVQSLPKMRPAQARAHASKWYEPVGDESDGKRKEVDGPAEIILANFDLWRRDDRSAVDHLCFTIEVDKALQGEEVFHIRARGPWAADVSTPRLRGLRKLDDENQTRVEDAVTHGFALWLAERTRRAASTLEETMPTGTQDLMPEVMEFMGTRLGRVKAKLMPRERAKAKVKSVTIPS